MTRRPKTWEFFCSSRIVPRVTCLIIISEQDKQAEIHRFAAIKIITSYKKTVNTLAISSRFYFP